MLKPLTYEQRSTMQFQTLSVFYVQASSLILVQSCVSDRVV